MGITAQDGFNAWLGYELYPFLIIGSIVAILYGLAYLNLNVIPRMKQKARQRRREREKAEALKKASGEK